MDNVFCTVLSKLRLYQAIALIGSLYHVLDEFKLYTLCVDDDTFNLLQKMKLQNVEAIHINELRDQELLELKNTRHVNEYCWTLKPVFIEQLFILNPQLGRVTYIDADLFFWADPTEIFTSQKEASVLLSRGDVLIPFLPNALVVILQELMGNYNSGFVSFKNDQIGCSCIEWWKNKCLHSCINKPSEGQFGDQKYLDEFQNLFSNVEEITMPGVNIGHWNNSGCHFYLNNGTIHVDGNKLICYHFSGFRIIDKNTIIQVHEKDRIDRPFFYDIYTDILRNAMIEVEDIDPDFNGFAIEEDLNFE